MSWCGRTDKGVHAAGNYVSLKLRKIQERTATKYDACDITKQDCCCDDEQNSTSPAHDPRLNMVNSNLPRDIRIHAIYLVPETFNARFSCLFRIYKYFFEKPNDENLYTKMQEASQCLVGEHDFRNFCKVNLENTTQFTRRILSINFRESEQVIGMMEIEICGLGFLWHQIRCIMAVLFMVGEGHEKPCVVQELLDVERHPCKPNYGLANEDGLVLFDCRFEEIPKTVSGGMFQELMLNSRRKYAVLDCMNRTGSPATPTTRNKHRPIFQLSTEPSLEERKAKKKQHSERKHTTEKQDGTAEDGEETRTIEMEERVLGRMVKIRRLLEKEGEALQELKPKST